MIMLVKNEFPKMGYSLEPLINSKGYDSKTMAYSIYHIARIEDIVCHTLMMDNEQVFFKGNYQNKMNSSIITTGNELVKEKIEEFSKKLDINILHEYVNEVYLESNEYIKSLKYDDLKKTVSEESKNNVIKSNCVSTDEEAFWLIDYWCNKNYLGLLKMPFSRHWIMHVEAFLKIKNTIITREKKFIIALDNMHKK